MTPAIKALEKSGVAFTVHEYAHDPSSHSYGKEAAQKLACPEDQVFKTLIVDTAINVLAVAVVPITGELSLRKMAAAAGVKKVRMAEQKAALRSTGYVLGGISPIGQKTALPTILDETALVFDSIFVSGGKRGVELQIAPNDLVRLTNAMVAVLTP